MKGARGCPGSSAVRDPGLSSSVTLVVRSPSPQGNAYFYFYPDEVKCIGPTSFPTRRGVVSRVRTGCPGLEQRETWGTQGA